ncbi:unnamed protein product [Meloidogyne enterolobii]|uniref:Uncharacterized protein n=1 Tax=Meloidogyne enterolobii TaxID=390850 RepID=A0ACB0ZG23_MELEN
MVIETQSQSQQSKQPTQQPPTLINISTAPLLTPESTLNLDQHPSAFNRVGRGINSAIGKGKLWETWKFNFFEN